MFLILPAIPAIGIAVQKNPKEFLLECTSHKARAKTTAKAQNVSRQ